jgi:selenoprotein W-related protein
LPRAAGLADKIRARYTQRIEDVELISSGGGVFEVTINGKLRFSKKSLGRFPEDEEIFRIIDSN